MDKVIGFTCGAFDLLHAGHIHFLTECSKRCDELVVGLHSNPQIDRSWKNKPIQSMYERYTQLKVYADYIVPYDTELDLENMMATMPINKRFVGSEYENQELTGQHMCDLLNIEIVYISRYHNYSSTELRNRLKDNT